MSNCASPCTMPTSGSGVWPRQRHAVSVWRDACDGKPELCDEYPSIGKFEGDRFDPREWRPQTPTTASMEMRDDDAFWAARRVAAFSDDLIRAAVHTGQFSDPAAETCLADVLIKRRDTIARIYLTAVNPIVAPRLDTNLNSLPAELKKS